MVGFEWRNSKQLAGIQANLQGAINGCRDGAIVEIDYSTALNLIEVIKQAKFSEKPSSRRSA